MLSSVPRVTALICLLLVGASFSEASAKTLRHAQRYLSAYVQVPATTAPRAANLPQGEPPIAALTTEGRAGRLEGRQQQQASSVVTKAAAGIADMPAALRPPTAACVKAQMKGDDSSRALVPPPAQAASTLATDAEDGEEQASSLHVKHIRNNGKYPVLVVNADWQPLSYLPLSVMRWQDAIKAIFLDRVIVLDYYDAYIQSTRSKVQLPSVICLKGYVKRHKETKTPALNRRNIFIRDQYRCQYCSVQMKSSDLTLDHVHPKSKGGKGTWENLVTACSSCNRKKGRKTLKEVKSIGMQLLRPPKRPTTAEIQSVARNFKMKHFVHESWRAYLGY